MRFVFVLTLLLGSSISKAASIDALVDNVVAVLTAQQIEVVRSDFAFLAKLKGSRTSKLHDQLFETEGVLEGSKYINFFEKRVSRLGFLKHANEGVVGVYSARRMSFTPSYFRLQQVDRVSVLIHEAAHFLFWTHASCPSPFLDKSGEEIVTPESKLKLEGRLACATRFEDAYVFQTVFLKNLAQYCDDCEQETKIRARFLAEELFKRILPASIRLKLIEDK